MSTTTYEIFTEVCSSFLDLVEDKETARNMAEEELNPPAAVADSKIRATQGMQLAGWVAGEKADTGHWEQGREWSAGVVHKMYRDENNQVEVARRVAEHSEEPIVDNYWTASGDSQPFLGTECFWSSRNHCIVVLCLLLHPVKRTQ